MNVISKIKEKVVRIPASVQSAALAVVAFVAAVPAHAAGELSGAITTELTDGKTEILAVAAVVLGLVGTLLLIRMVRRSAS